MHLHKQCYSRVFLVTSGVLIGESLGIRLHVTLIFSAIVRTGAHALMYDKY